ncbi:MAG: flagellar hook-basal body protein [Fimbriimonadales bacterium]
MTRGINAAAAGMKTCQTKLDVLANNLANVSTIGFKRDELAFADMLERNITDTTGRFPRDVGRLGSGPTLAREVTVGEVGPAISSDNPLDLRLDKPNQYFAVRTPEGVRYTRDGATHITSDGTLVNSQGYAYLDVGNTPIKIEGNPSLESIKVQPNGAISVNGAEQSVLNVVEGDLQKVGDNLYDGQPKPASDSTVVSGSLEGSNVNAVQTMVEMIDLQRNFEASQRAIRTQDELTEQLIRSLASR